MSSYPFEVIRDLANGALPWSQLHQMMSGYKDADRFTHYVRVVQERTGWSERVLLPLTDRLFIVDTGTAGIVRCECGHDFCDYRENWKLHARVRIRDDDASLGEIYGLLRPDPEWMELREFICPGCAGLLEVEASVPGYPITFDFLPDLRTFYEDWLESEPPSWSTDGG